MEKIATSTALALVWGALTVTASYVLIELAFDVANRRYGDAANFQTHVGFFLGLSALLVGLGAASEALDRWRGVYIFLPVGILTALAIVSLAFGTVTGVLWRDESAELSFLQRIAGVVAFSLIGFSQLAGLLTWMAIYRNRSKQPKSSQVAKISWFVAALVVVQTLLYVLIGLVIG